MKILILNDAGKSAHYWQRLGLARAFTAAGHDCILWDMTLKSSHDAFDEFEPDIFIGQTYTLTPAMIDCINERPALKVILKASDFGPISKEVSLKYPVLIANQEEIDMVSKLNKEHGIDYLFIHYHEDFLEKTHSYWKDLNLKVYSDLNAADTFDYCNGKYSKKYACDIGYVGGRWDYKAVALDPYLLNLCSEFNHNIKIFGRGWSCPQSCGYLPDGEEKDFYKSSKINICIHEPHSQEYGYDITEKFFKVAIGKNFIISDSVYGLNKLFPHHIKVKTPAELQSLTYEILSDYSNYSCFIKDSIERNYDECLKKHTYFDRAADIFERLDLQLESNNIIKSKAKFIESNLT